MFSTEASFHLCCIDKSSQASGGWNRQPQKSIAQATWKQGKSSAVRTYSFVFECLTNCGADGNLAAACLGGDSFAGAQSLNPLIHL